MKNFKISLISKNEAGGLVKEIIYLEMVKYKTGGWWAVFRDMCNTDILILEGVEGTAVTAPMLAMTKFTLQQGKTVESISIT